MFKYGNNERSQGGSFFKFTLGGIQLLKEIIKIKC